MRRSNASGEALPIALELGGWPVIDTYRYLVELLIQQDRIEEARELCAFARRDVTPEDPYARASHLIAEALVQAADRELESARHSFTEALALLTEHQLLIDLAEAQVVFSRILRGLGEEQDALTQLASATTDVRAGRSAEPARRDRARVHRCGGAPGAPGAPAA